MLDLWRIKTALLSCSDKSHLEPLARMLFSHGVKIISTGGTGQMLKNWSIPFQEISDFTGHPEAFQGRMKTISFKCASSLLFQRQNAQDELEASQLGIEAIDLVVCNLYPFEKASNETEDRKVWVENIDIGGPLMIRAAAKNFASVTVLTSPDQYLGFMKDFSEQKGELNLKQRSAFAASAFTMIAQYDVAIAQKLGSESTKFLTLNNAKTLRYGENPHQEAKFYEWKNSTQSSLAQAQVIQGKELSYNNLLDADAAWKAMSDVQQLYNNEGVAAVVVKHGNPCGFVHAPEASLALELAWKGDEISSFGGIVAVSHPLDLKHVEFFSDKFIEILMAPDFTPSALKFLALKKNLRVMKLPVFSKNKNEETMRSISGGILFQNEDESLSAELQSVTQKKFSLEDFEVTLFGVLAAKYLKSNSIALVRSSRGVKELVGAGMGQPNRLDSFLKLALPRIQEKSIPTSEVVMVSDAFFPFSDSIEVAAQAGITKIVQPGGSIRDKEVFAAADRLGIAMICTGERHFRH
jgi:phosphoribosylaminoimidazolecarboxamide formyltransferase/IMP cyclohydrolase